MTKNLHIKTKEIYYTYVQKIPMTFVYDSLHQKQNFLNLIACHIHQPSQLWNEKIDNEYYLIFKNMIIQNYSNLFKKYRVHVSYANAFLSAQ